MIAPARRASLDVLLQFRSQKEQQLDLILHQMINQYSLTRQDASLTEKIVIGVIQNQTLCDTAIKTYSRSKADPVVGEILRIAVYQILFLDRVPVSAVVNDAVSSCKWKNRSHSTGYVNAVLHQICKNRSYYLDYPEENLQQICTKYSHPEWLAEKLTNIYGLSFTRSFFAANNESPPITLKINSVQIEPKQYYDLLSSVNVTYIVSSEDPETVTIPSGNVTKLPGYHEGFFYVQDEAASTAVSVLDLQPSMKILDACAAPGGKTIAAAVRTKNQATIIASDISSSRLERMQENIARLQLSSVKLLQNDASVRNGNWIGRFDAVIADVPCSGMGTIRKRPEIRWKEYSSIQNLIFLQKQILCTQAEYVKPGGSLLYATCSILQEENEDIVNAFLAEQTAFRPEAFPIKGNQIQNGMYTFWPHIDGTDGFFIAKLRRDPES